MRPKDRKRVLIKPHPFIRKGLGRGGRRLCGGQEPWGRGPWRLPLLLGPPAGPAPASSGAAHRPE